MKHVSRISNEGTSVDFFPEDPEDTSTRRSLKPPRPLIVLFFFFFRDTFLFYYGGERIDRKRERESVCVCVRERGETFGCVLQKKDFFLAEKNRRQKLEAIRDFFGGGVVVV